MLFLPSALVCALVETSRHIRPFDQIIRLWCSEQVPGAKNLVVFDFKRNTHNFNALQKWTSQQEPTDPS